MIIDAPQDRRASLLSTVLNGIVSNPQTTQDIIQDRPYSDDARYYKNRNNAWARALGQPHAPVAGAASTGSQQEAQSAPARRPPDLEAQLQHDALTAAQLRSCPLKHRESVGGYGLATMMSSRVASSETQMVTSRMVPSRMAPSRIWVPAYVPHDSYNLKNFFGPYTLACKDDRNRSSLEHDLHGHYFARLTNSLDSGDFFSLHTPGVLERVTAVEENWSNGGANFVLEDFFWSAVLERCKFPERWQKRCRYARHEFAVIKAAEALMLAIDRPSTIDMAYIRGCEETLAPLAIQQAEAEKLAKMEGLLQEADSTTRSTLPAEEALASTMARMEIVDVASRHQTFAENIVEGSWTVKKLPDVLEEEVENCEHADDYTDDDDNEAGYESDGWDDEVVAEFEQAMAEDRKPELEKILSVMPKPQIKPKNTSRAGEFHRVRKRRTRC